MQGTVAGYPYKPSSVPDEISFERYAKAKANGFYKSHAANKGLMAVLLAAPCSDAIAAGQPVSEHKEGERAASNTETDINNDSERKRKETTHECHDSAKTAGTTSWLECLRAPRLPGLN